MSRYSDDTQQFTWSQLTIMIISFSIGIIGAIIALLNVELRWIGIGMVVFTFVGVFGAIIGRLIMTKPDVSF